MFITSNTRKMTMNEIKIEQNNPPFWKFAIFTAFWCAVVAAALFLGGKAFSPQAFADAAQTRALIDGQAAYEKDLQALDLDKREAVKDEEIQTEQAKENAKQRLLWAFVGTVFFVLGTGVIVHVIRKRIEMKKAAAELALFEAQKQQEAENPVHTPTGYGLTQYTREGVVYTHCKYTGMTIRADDARANEVLAKQRAVIIGNLFLAAIHARRDVEIEKAKHGKAQTPAVQHIEEWVGL